MKPEVSVIIPCYNSAKYVAECLDSVLAQTFNNYEVIIVNDGSTDNSLEIIKSYVEKYKNFKLINQPNLGVGVARNNAIEQAVGKYIYPLDADDKIAPECLERLYGVITTTNNRVVACEVQMFGKRIGFFHQPKFTKYEMYGWHECCVISALFYKDDFEKFGGYKIDFNGYGGDDMDYWLNYIDYNLPMIRLPEILFFYRIKDSTESLWKNYSKLEMKKRIIYKEKKLLKYHPKMHFYAFAYKIINSKLLKFFYQKKVSKQGKVIVKICKIPLHKIFSRENYNG